MKLVMPQEPILGYHVDAKSFPVVPEASKLTFNILDIWNMQQTVTNATRLILGKKSVPTRKSYKRVQKRERERESDNRARGRKIN